LSKLALYLLLIFVAFGLIAAVLGFIAQTSARAAQLLLEAVAFLVGKSGRTCKVTIPSELYEARRTSSSDQELTTLKNYHPGYIPAAFPSIPVLTDNEKCHSAWFVNELTEFIHKANVLEYRTDPIDYSFIADVEAKQIPSDLLVIPKKPSPPPPPPAWTPWVVVTEDAKIELPTYSGHLAFLNKLVEKCYEKEIAEVATVQREIENLRTEATKRNANLERIASGNLAKYQACLNEIEDRWNTDQKRYSNELKAYTESIERAKADAIKLGIEIHKPGSDGLLARVQYALTNCNLPKYISRESSTSFDSTSGVLIHEHSFPDLSTIEWIKLAEPRSQLDKLKNIKLKKPATIKERKEAASKIYPSLSLKLCQEILSQDNEEIIKAIAINGWCNYIEKSTGQSKRAYCSSLFATREQILELQFDLLDPVEAFAKLKGITAKTIYVTPILPIIRLDTNDSRFVDSREILSNLSEGENLAAMDWEDFEHLCRELFEKAFAGSGAEVKVTQASRDQGVDAIVFDPDPIRGGKIIIQAKRYTNTVDVSAVRDLYGALINEGATKGILVTTSQYGPESYAFAKDKPITLLNGQELLGLLEKFNYNNFIINLEDAKKATADRVNK
jgi:restriction system protein